MDISDFQATEKVQIGQAAKGVSTRVDFKLKLVSRSKVNVQRTATVTGVQNGIEVYSVSQVASIKGSKNGKEGSTELKLAAYVPTAEGTIQWTASVEDEDPDADVATRTTVVTLPPPVVLDLDIDSFQVPGALEVGKGKVEFKLKILSRSNAEGQRTLTVSGVRNGLEVYRFTQLVTVKKGKTDFKQPSPYVPTAAGTIQWTATVLDDDADVDVVVRTTVVTARPSQDDDEEDDGDEDDI
jgi:hypothetical protein